MKSNRVVVVEDDSVMMLCLTNYLTANGYSVCGASNYDDALACIAKMSPDLILLDVNLGNGKSGYDIAAMLNTSEEYKDIPKVFITGEKDDTTRCKAFVSGAVDFIRKPFNLEDLGQRIAPLVKIGKMYRLLKELTRE